METMKVKISKKSCSVIAAIWMFCLIYHPPFFSINFLYVLAPISWLYLLANKKFFSRSINKKQLYETIICLVVLILYQTLISMFNGRTPFQASIGMIWWVVAIIPTCLSIKGYLEIHHFKNAAFWNSLGLAALLQCAFSLAAFLNPSIQELFLTNIEITSAWLLTRMFGFARYLTGFTGMTQGFISALFLYLGMNYKKSYIILVPFIILSGVVNARTSLVILAGAGILVFLFSKLGFKWRMIWSGILAVFIVTIISIYTYLADNATNDTVKWIIEAVEVVIKFFNGETTGYFIYTANADKHTLPSGLSLIFGEGTRIFTKQEGIRYTSDIGFVNDVWVGGLAFCLMYYSFIIFELRLIYKSVNEIEKKNKFVLIGIILVGFIVCNIKGIVNTDNDFIAAVILLMTNYSLFKPRQSSVQVSQYGGE